MRISDWSSDVCSSVLIVARAIDDDRIGIGRPDRADDRVHRALAKRELVDLTALDRDETGPHQPLQPAAFEFAGQEIADFDLEVVIIAEPAEGSRRPGGEHTLVDFHLGPAAHIVAKSRPPTPRVD